MKINLKKKSLTIGQVAQLSGVNRETLRYYERQKLIDEPARSESGYRHYPLETVKRIRFIKRAQELGFCLDEVREFLALSVSQQATCQDIKQRAENKVNAIEKKLRDLERMRDRLIQLTDECSGSGALEECPILDAFTDEET